MKQLLDLQPGMEVLDLCCGQGRLMVPLAQWGYRMAGLDLSEYLLGWRARRQPRLIPDRMASG